ncbi:isoprenylcysteine carboxylmethyltransferase family protein [Sinorhizobium sp. 8-89]|uniref:methyltransferase family protein n=1 Tax=Sinorhizobium sp. 7-81 TaxID=3049087 RepID=UPI0024C306D2|nr:isoprenylcysteine carboxylmethyltransferase family protein [Sinorhizobium sp. 7-81]MDK1388264.1 isoprenylcysteine carboxylmethyltransferase family protein [Sinorhizobium sp. 7-81]
MSDRLEDLIGKGLIIVVFFFFAVQQGAAIMVMIDHRETTDYWGLAFTSRALGLLFLCMVVCLTLIRLPSRRNAEGAEPRLSALAGTFILMIIPVLPGGSIGPGLLLFSTVLVAVGFALSIYCLFWLGRSFSIMATARELVTGGPYAIVRHPLYAAEAVSAVGFLIANWSLAAFVVGAAHFAFQFRRMFNEERVLRATFSDYPDYASRVPMLIPRLSRPIPGTERG